MAFRKLLAALLGTGICSYAGAHTFCVTTTGELRDALTAISDGGAYAAERNFIGLAAGTFSIDDGLGRFVYRNTSADGELQFWGGFNADCSLKSDDASLTILDGANMSQVLVASNTAGYIDILTLTIQNANSNQNGSGIDINDTNDDVTGDVLLRDLIIRNNETTGAYAGFRAFTRGDHSIYFDNNLVVDNSSGKNYAAGQLYGEGPVFMRYDTVSNNTAPGASLGGVLCFGTPTCEIANSVFWMNSNSDLNLLGDAKMYYDDVGVLGGVSPSANQNAVTGDPLFADPASGNYHLGNGSPLLAVSTYLESDTDNDLDGHNLPLTGTTDVGAYVDTIFNDNLETPP